jgi:N-acetyl-alpha-D-muramate 1-phosphate uridylyltransferase
MMHNATAVAATARPGFMPRTAMALAAGLGRRMRPLTETTPKPLLPVNGRTLLDRVLDRFAEMGIERVVVNLHHHRAAMEKHLTARTDLKVQFSPETELLETGGGVKHALPLVGSEPFFVANGDVLWLDGKRPALERLASAWDDANMDALLLVQSGASAQGYEGVGDYFLDQIGRLRRKKLGQVAPFVFAGVQILHPRLFQGAPDGPFSLNLLYDRAEAADRLYGLVHAGPWFHVGTPDDLVATEKELIDLSGRARRA